MTCIPPSARFHELATLCHEHAGLCKLPDLNPEDSLQDRIEKKIDQKFDAFAEQQTLRVDKNATSTNSFFPSLSGKSATTRESTLLKALQDSDEANLAVHQLRFCLPCEFKDEVHSKPPNYRHVNALQIDHSNKPPRIPVSDDICHCVERCGESCINKMLYTECNGDIANQGNTNCAIGLNCGNRQLGQRKAAKCKPQREQGKGWGLCPIGNVEKGALVQEYVGDVVDSKEKEQRLIRWSEDHPNDTNFYVMALQSGWFIDARDVANLSRFVNHSCEPNCRLLQINVNGRMRCGIFALRDIDAGEFLSYDYHFDTRQGDRFVCCCGSRHCRGTMKGGSTQNDGNARKSKIELFEEAKASFERDKKFMADYYDDKEARKTQVGINVPGADVGNVDDTVANGPQLKHRPAVYCNRIFLWRTAVQGSDFSTRLASLENQPLTE